jgi:hypothetical protein
LHQLEQLQDRIAPIHFVFRHLQRHLRVLHLQLEVRPLLLYWNYLRFLLTNPKLDGRQALKTVLGHQTERQSLRQPQLSKQFHSARLSRSFRVVPS